jgi:xylulokinase
MRDLLLGLDVGTSSLKALVCTAHARVLGTAHADYPLSTPQPGWSEQDPDLWVAAAYAAIPQALQRAGVDGRRIAAIGIAGQMHGAVLVDRAGAPVRPAMLWNDGRSTTECQQLTEQIGAHHILARTGNRLLPGFTAPKVAWVQMHEPAAWARTAQILLPKDYLRFRLGHAWHTDVSDASGTLYFDVASRAWSAPMLKDLRIAPSLVPPAHESAHVADAVNLRTSAATGLTEGTPMVAGAGDQAAGAIGTGVVNPGRLSCVLGTSGVIFAASDSFSASPDGALHAFCHAAPDRWHLMSVMLSAAGSMRWFADALGNATPEELDAMAHTVPPGCHGLRFLPTLAGERCPFPDPNATGAFTGMTLTHTCAHFARAVIEGVTASMLLCLQMIRRAGVPVTDIAISGGGFQSQLWTTCCADAFGVPLVRMNSADGAALGGALLASVGAGLNATVQDAAVNVQPTTHTRQTPTHAEFWETMAAEQQALYQALRPNEKTRF